MDERIQIDETRNEIGNPSELFCYARRSIAEKLLEAARNLPSGYSFCIKEAYRPLSLQKSFFEEAYAFYREKYPDQTETELYELTCQFAAPIEVAGHTTGGAIDLTLLKDGKEIEMGSGFNETPIAPQNLTYTYSKSISETAKKIGRYLFRAWSKLAL